MKARPILFSGPMIRALLEGRKTQTRRKFSLQPDVDYYGEPRHVGMFNPTVVDRHGDEQPGDDTFGCWTSDGEWALKCPYGQPGDLLWVRETWGYRCLSTSFIGGQPPENSQVTIQFKADGSRHTVTRPVNDESGLPKQRRPLEGESREDYDRYLSDWWKMFRPSIHMPRWASRLTLRITDVRVQRLQEISEEDARAEGCVGGDGMSETGASWCKSCRGTGWVACAPNGDETECGCVLGGRPEFKHLWESINGADSWSANPWIWAITFEAIKANVDEVLKQAEAA